jgi:two-component system KDP operon response regulator KdpE
VHGKRILVIDDDADMVELIRFTFAEAGADVYSATSGREGICEFGVCQPDLILLDVMMPELDGWETCRLFREFTNVPIIFLTALNSDEEEIRGLNLGAVDFVTKPYRPQVLLARAQAALRAYAYTSTTQENLVYDDGYLSVDQNRRQVRVDGELAQLTATEYRLLTHLIRHRGQVLTYEQILGHVWGWEYRDSVDYVHVYVSYLRRKIERDPGRPGYILNERGIGYRFAAERPSANGRASWLQHAS